jgi:hypothetical protein
MRLHFTNSSGSPVTEWLQASKFNSESDYENGNPADYCIMLFDVPSGTSDGVRTSSTNSNYGSCVMDPAKFYSVIWNNISGYVSAQAYGSATSTCGLRQGTRTGDTTIHDSTLYSPFFELNTGTSFFGGTGCDYAVSGTISADTEWSAGTHIISGTVTINSGKTLTIDPGAIIKFDTATTSGIVVNGSLNADGDRGNNKPIFFTSLKDDLIGGDSGGDGGTTTPAAGDWSGITINSGGSAALDYSVVRYGGSASGSNAMLYNNGGTLNVEASSTISDGSDYGIRNSSGTTNVDSSDVANNIYGVYQDGGSVTVGDASIIQNNAAYGIYNNTTSSTTATGNYWGDSSGPANASNPGGSGDSVSSYVSFNPWIGTSTLHFIEGIEGCPSSTCASVQSGQLVLNTTNTSFLDELGMASSTWNALGKVSIVGTTTSSASVVEVQDTSETDGADLAFKGQWFGPNDEPANTIQLNRYYLDSESSAQIQNTITHELGHALGLDHSYLGNVMFLGQTNRTSLGPQDINDYNYLWP